MNGNLQRSARTLAGNVFGWCSYHVLRLGQGTGRLLKKAGIKRHLSSQTLRKALPLMGTIAGAVAFALWLDNIAAGVFAFILLFLLSRIGRSLEHIAAQQRTQSAAALHPTWRAPSQEPAKERNIYISSKAMERLRPWVEEDSSLTEESAKAYCSVLLDTLAMLHPRLAGRGQAEDS